MTVDAPTTRPDTTPGPDGIVWHGPDELRPLLVDLQDLEPLPGNPRRGDIEAVARSLHRFGQRKNVTVRPSGITTAGNHTLAAARSLGWTHLAVVTIDEDDTTAVAWALADNHTADLATNDDADLAAMLADIAAADADLLAATSYTADDLTELLALVDTPTPDDEPAPAPPARDPSPWVPDPPAPRTEPVSVTVLHGDSRDVLADLAEASMDSIVTDPPYGLEFMGKDWDRFRVDDRSARWAGNERTGGAGAGFGEESGEPYSSLPAYGRRRTTNECRACGKRDAFRNAQPCPSVADSTNHDWVAVPVDPVPIEMRAFQNWCYQWAVAAYRVLKPGGHLVAFGGSRTYHRLASALEDAGFEIRDSLHWMYGSGFPKSLDVSKQIDKAAGADRPDRVVSGPAGNQVFQPTQSVLNAGTPVTDEAKRWDGWGTGLKPSHEPIVLARKPLDGTVAATVQKWGTGALNIAAARTPGREDDQEQGAYDGSGAVPVVGSADRSAVYPAELGRWPANVVLSHASGCTPDGCAPACPIATLGGKLDDDEADVARYFTQTAWTGEDAGMPVMVYVPKPSTAERNAGLDELPKQPRGEDTLQYHEGVRREDPPVANFHPTVKPVALMRWLVRLVTPPGGTVLEPFTGSGTTLVAAVLEGFDSVGVELTADYLPIIDARVAWAQAQCGTSEP